jgi:hypothetical protein
MKIITYYYDGYDKKPIWFDEAVGGLQRYYHKYDISVSNLSYKNNKTLENFIKLVGRNWNSMMTSRVLYLNEFLKTDYDMMIVTDLDYVVLRADINIRNYLNSDFIVPHCCYFNSTNGSHEYTQNKMKFYDSLYPGSYKSFSEGVNFVHMSCDYFVMSRKACIEMINYYNMHGWDLSNPHKFAEKYLTYDLNTMIDEGFYGSYLNYIHESNKIQTTCEYKDGPSPISSSTWGDYEIDLRKLCAEKRIFHHFGTISHKPNELLNLLLLFKKD